jgi:hypothetical protein
LASYISISKEARMSSKLSKNGAYVEHGMDCFHDTGLPSEKVFMLPDKMRIRATIRMRLKHKLHPEASKMNIVPNPH